MRPLILASASPRRQQLLQESGFEFETISPDVEEVHDASMTSEALTIENARRKAMAVAAGRPEAVVLGADTLVYIDGVPLAKPADLVEARSMLRRLSGRTHHVCTGVALARAGSMETFAVITHVTFRQLTDAMIDDYLARVHVLDKAGAYAAQEHGDLIIEQIDGSLLNVIGLPMEAVTSALRRLL